MKKILLWASLVAVASAGLLLLLAQISGDHWFKFLYLLPYVAGIVVSGNVHQPSEVATVVALFGQQFLLAVLVVWCVTWLGKP
jgi:hypothetical protein